MDGWDRRLADLLASTGTASVDDLGGIAAVPAAAVVSPLFAHVAEAIVAAWGSLAGEDREAAVRLIVEAAESAPSALALRSLCDTVVPPAPALGMTNALKDALRRRVDDRNDERTAPTAAAALKGLCHLALLDESARFLLFDALGRVGDSPEYETFAITAAWVAGAAFDRWREPTAAGCLERLASSDAEPDAAFWLGQTMLLSALELDDVDAIRTALRGTLEHFDRAAAAGEDRPDALLYASTVRFVTEYAASADADVLAGHLDAAKAAHQHYLVDGIGLPEGPAWMRPRFDAEARWVELLERLHLATAAEDRDAWYQAPQMIDGLADAYLAAHTLSPARTYLAPDAVPTWVVEAVLPRLAAPFIDDVAPLAYLDRWLEQSDHPDATLIHQAITQRRTEAVTRGKARPSASTRR